MFGGENVLFVEYEILKGKYEILLREYGILILIIEFFEKKLKEVLLVE